MKKIFLMSAVVMMIFIFPAKINAAANWIWVYSDDEFSIWIDNNSINKDGNGFFAYFKWTCSDAGKNKIIEHRRSNGFSVSKFYNLSYTMTFNYFKNFEGTKYNSIMQYVYYDKKGNVLDIWSTNDFNWQRIIPETIVEEMYDAAYARVRGK